MFRKPIFWIVFAIVSIGSVFFTLKFFPQAFPLINLDLKMDRETALQLADSLSQKHHWGPAGYKTAASFGLDNVVQNFVELEAGGTEAFRKFLSEGLYSPYTWRVRHFKENETNETMIRFTPAGQPYGFREKLPENQAGAALAADSALSIAEKTARESWNIDFAPYELVEKSQEARPGKRTDHSFVYERKNEKIGEARYRLRLVVGGDKLTELTHFMKIPEAFSRRYEEMRSANETIASADLIVMAVLYGIAGCIGGIFYLLRKKWLQWRKPIFWAAFIAALQVLVSINNWPLAWMSYDTAISAQGFFFQQILQLLVIFLAEFGLLGLTFMVAESLTRKAFPDQIQFWRVWSPGVANSKSILGQTIGGFIMVAIFLAFDVAVYFIATKLLGWWSPSEALFEPDILATYFPWLSSIAISLHAGFWEECMFRAIPLAGAALIGDRFGKRRLMIVIALVIQALVFGAGHANYPQQPAYARIIELFIPALAFGGLYLYFGLLPAIVMHFVYDVVWFALPLFVSTAAGIWVDQLLVIILTVVPLFIILWYWLKKRKLTEVSEADYNRAWQPTNEAASEAAVEEIETIAVTPAPLRMNLILGLGGVLGVILWFISTSFQNEAPKMNLTRQEAVEIANKTLTEKNINLSASWKTLSTLETPNDQNDRFIWQTAGEEKYRELMGSFISPPQWRVRFAQFEGDLAERAEEYQVFISNTGEVLRFLHQLPERRPGASLAETDAKKLADSVIVNRFQLKPEELKQVSIEPAKLKERMDWIVTYADTLHQPLKEGEARLRVKISGDEIADSYRFVYVPEDWARQERNEQNMTQIVNILTNILRVIIILIAVVNAIIAWSRKKFSVRMFLIFAGIIFVIQIIEAFNQWPAITINFSTAEPLKNQVAITIGFLILGVLVMAAGLALVIGFIHKLEIPRLEEQKWHQYIKGFGLGFLFAGLQAVVSRFAPSLVPDWADYDAVSSYLPWLAEAFSPFTGLIVSTTLLILIFLAANYYTKNWTKLKVPFALLIIVWGLISTNLTAAGNISFWLIKGIISGVLLLLFYLIIIRYQLALVPLVAGAMILLGSIKHIIQNPHPAAIMGGIISLFVVILIVIFWHWKLAYQNE